MQHGDDIARAIAHPLREPRPARSFARVLHDRAEGPPIVLPPDEPIVLTDVRPVPTLGGSESVTR